MKTLPIIQGQDMFTDDTSLKKISLCSMDVNSSFPISTLSSSLSPSSVTFRHLQTQRAMLSERIVFWTKQYKNTQKFK